MVTVFDIPQDLLIKRLAIELKKRYAQVSPPIWTLFIKTGSHTERRPQDKDWWYTRCASLLRKVYLYSPVGLKYLKSQYGGSKNVKYYPSHHRVAGGKIIRKALEQLESSGLITKNKDNGRILTSQGRALLDRISTEIFKDITKIEPSLLKYG